MSSSSRPSRSSSPVWDDFFDDPIAALLAVVVGGAFVIGSLPMWLDGVTEWCISHHILVAAQANPMIALPGADGAGLDARRLIVVCAAGVGVAALTFSAIRSRLRREF